MSHRDDLIAQGIPPGAATVLDAKYNSTWNKDSTGTVNGIVGPDAVVQPVIISSTFVNALANYPASSNSNRTIRMTDLNNALFTSDGTNYHPQGGSQVIAGDYGSLASPLATFTGATSGQMAQPGGNTALPIGLIVPGKTFLRPFAHIRRRGTNATANVYIKIGTAAALTDPTAWAVATAGSTNFDYTGEPFVFFTSSTTYTTTHNIIITGTTGVTAAQDRTGSINTAAIQYMTFWMDTGNASDFFDLISYRLRIESVPG